MIYLIKHLSKKYDIIMIAPSTVPDDIKYNIISLPTNSTKNDLQRSADYSYYKNQYEILVQNKDKFVIALTKYFPNRFKDAVYVNFYTNLLDSSMQLNTNYKNLLENSPHHHYAILNYHNGKIEEYIKKEDAIEKLNQYINEFIIEYKPNIVKEFSSKEELLEYITLEKVNL